MYGDVTLYVSPSQSMVRPGFSLICVARLQFDLVIDFQVELFPLHSPFLGESLLVSFPPLINMLKFSG